MYHPPDPSSAEALVSTGLARAFGVGADSPAGHLLATTHQIVYFKE